VRPPGAIPGASAPVVQPRWPIVQQPYPPPRAATGYAPPPQPGAPMSIEAPGARDYPQQQRGAPPSNLQAPPGWQRAQPGTVQSQPYPPPSAERDGVEGLPPYAQPGAPPSTMLPPPQQQPLPSLGPQRNPQVAAATPVEVRPAATLACPIVSALDRWIANAVQPAAQKWFNQPVVEIKQISAYSCRGMNGQLGAHISEHAFGNALDIAGFVLANGHRITVKDGWHGSPEEQGFLRDVQGSACDQFTTVLAPGSNQFHYDHIHVDLMRRASGRRICQPGAIDGEVVAARARKGPIYASRPVEPPPSRNYDPPIDPENDPFAWRGDRRDPATTGSIAGRRPGGKSSAAEDLDWIEEPGPRPAIDWTTDRFRPQ
jgi:extensin-like protein